MPAKRIIGEDTVLSVDQETTGTAVKIDIQIEGERKCVIHWGMRLRGRDAWAAPPLSVWPEGTTAFDRAAVRTPLAVRDGRGEVSITIGRSPDLLAVEFALFFPDEDRWDNNGGRNYRIDLSPSGVVASPPLQEVLETETEEKEISHKRLYQLGEGYELAVAVWREGDNYLAGLAADIDGPLLLHWGVSRRSRPDWDLPPDAMRPPGTEAFDKKAVRTPFHDLDGLRRLTLEISVQDAPSGISFVLYQPDTGRWFKDSGRNFYLPIAVLPEREIALGSAELSDLAEEIVEHETGRNSWTLMHRFNLCYDLLEKTKTIDGLALIFAWLRFSSIRQLDWQRNYNTKPRELGHAMDRLTLKLAGRYGAEPGDREILRLIFRTMGRGSDAQRVRDEVLNIMHRHHIKEVSGHFMEEWHQKLHNNATPDDIVICEAYLSFLRGNGSLDRFYEKLNEGGLTRERLESYERPIVSHPDFVPYLKDALIRDFEHFLGILKEVYSGTDLGTAIHAARYLFDADMHRLMDRIWRDRDDSKIVPLVREIIEGRRRLSSLMKGHADRIRDLLFLDIALEDFSRTSVERNFAAGLSRDELADLIEAMLEIMDLSADDQELTACLRHWRRLAAIERFSRDWALHADSVIDRIHRVIGSFIDRYYRLIQPKAEFLGGAFKADTWAVTLFSEEVVRGMPAFALSMLLQKLNPILRKAAELGDWQIISPGAAEGYVEVTASLKSVQGKRFDRRTVIVSDTVAGDEEIPEGIVALVTPASTDALAHVAIRARNAGILFAVCYNAEKLDGLKKLRGAFASLSINAAGEVLFEQTSAQAGAELPAKKHAAARFNPPSFSAFAVSLEEFTGEIVGGKSLNIKKMFGRLPDWIHLPASVAIPYGIFERVLGEKENRDVARRCEELTGTLARNDASGDEETLKALRTAILDLKAPAELPHALREVMTGAGLPWPENWDGAWTCIRKVWASKWNTRAYLARVARGIAHEDLYMAVLIQRIVEADYSYVIHTVNPFTGNRNEIYAEAVLGLGEALVANYPGRALSFLVGRNDKAQRLLSYPGKSVGLFGGGLTFRSDSNGEDLEGYAGAGLYDSFMMPEPRHAILDYTDERIVWDGEFRRRFMEGVAEIGELVENALGVPQDIEGAFSGEKFYVVQARPQVGIRNG